MESLQMEAGVGIEGRPPSALLLRARFRPDNTGSARTWQDCSASALPAHFQCPVTEQSTEGTAERLLVCFAWSNESWALFTHHQPAQQISNPAGRHRAIRFTWYAKALDVVG